MYEYLQTVINIQEIKWLKNKRVMFPEVSASICKTFHKSIFASALVSYLKQFNYVVNVTITACPIKQNYLKIVNKTM